MINKENMALKLAKKSSKVQKINKKIVPAKHVSGSKPVTTAKGSTLTYPTGDYIEAIGRRKVATARVRLYKTTGDFIINDKLVIEYFNTIPNVQALYNKPFELTNTLGNFTVVGKVSGSGLSSQLDAIIHGIAQALVKYDASNKTHLKAAGYITRDDRMKETRKMGHGGKARRKRQSPKR